MQGEYPHEQRDATHLLVEDEKAIRDAVTAYLERENYWVTAVGDGQDAWKSSRSITSIWSFWISCFPACRRARLPRDPQTPPMCRSSC